MHPHSPLKSPPPLPQVSAPSRGSDTPGELANRHPPKHPMLLPCERKAPISQQQRLSSYCRNHAIVSPVPTAHAHAINLHGSSTGCTLSTTCMIMLLACPAVAQAWHCTIGEGRGLLIYPQPHIEHYLLLSAGTEGTLFSSSAPVPGWLSQHEQPDDSSTLQQPSHRIHP